MLLPDSTSKKPPTRSSQPSHLRPTTSTHNKQVKRVSKYPEKENNQYFTIQDHAV